MPLTLVGISHRQADLEVRERVAFLPDELPKAVAALKQRVGQCAILSTCNRTELYAFSDEASFDGAALLDFLSGWHRVSEAAIRPFVYEKRQAEAIRHLFRVASGIDSMVLGESEILGQVRECYKLALRSGALGKVMARLFQKGLEVGKRARASTGVARRPISVSSVAVALARETLGRVDSATVVVLGAGETGRSAARALMSFGASRLLIVTRDPHRARAAFAPIGGEVLPVSRLDEVLRQADVVIASAASAGYVISADRLATALNGQLARPVVIMDIAVPRNVEPSVAELPCVRLYNIDDLQAESQANLALRQADVQAIEVMIDHAVESFMVWWEALEVEPTIRALMGRAEALRRRELSRALARLGPLSERDADTIDALTSSIVNKMLHTAIDRLKSNDGSLDRAHLLPAVRELFRLD